MKPIVIPHNTEEARDMLVTLNRIYHVPWQRMSDFLGVPIGTLWAIAGGMKVPRKWKHKLGIYYKRNLYSMPVAELRWALENREEM